MYFYERILQSIDVYSARRLVQNFIRSSEKTLVQGIEITFGTVCNCKDCGYCGIPKAVQEHSRCIHTMRTSRWIVLYNSSTSMALMYRSSTFLQTHKHFVQKALESIQRQVTGHKSHKSYSNQLLPRFWDYVKSLVQTDLSFHKDAVGTRFSVNFSLLDQSRCHSTALPWSFGFKYGHQSCILLSEMQLKKSKCNIGKRKGNRRFTNKLPVKTVCLVVCLLKRGTRSGRALTLCQSSDLKFIVECRYWLWNLWMDDSGMYN